MVYIGDGVETCWLGRGKEGVGKKTMLSRREATDGRREGDGLGRWILLVGRFWLLYATLEPVWRVHPGKVAEALTPSRQLAQKPSDCSSVPRALESTLILS